MAQHTKADEFDELRASVRAILKEDATMSNVPNLHAQAHETPGYGAEPQTFEAQASKIVLKWYRGVESKILKIELEDLERDISVALVAARAATKAECEKIVRHEFLGEGQDAAVRRIIEAIEALP